MSQRLNVEPLEDRNLLSPLGDFLALLNLGPVTAWHYSPADNFHNGPYNAPGDPGSVGFNLVDIYSPQQLASVPTGCKAMVNLVQSTNGVDANFINQITPFLGNPKVFGFYLADEPNPAQVPASNIKAESDWIHANDPGAKTFIVLGAGPFLPFGPNYTPSNTDIDYVGLDPYPIRTWGEHYEYIPLAVLTAEFMGWNQGQIIPVYQAFGSTGTFVSPGDAQEWLDLAVWGMYVPNPAFDYAYSWGEWGATSLIDRPDLQGVFQEHNTQPPFNLLTTWVKLAARVDP